MLNTLNDEFVFCLGEEFLSATHHFVGKIYEDEIADCRDCACEQALNDEYPSPGRETS